MKVDITQSSRRVSTCVVCTKKLLELAIYCKYTSYYIVGSIGSL